MILRMFFATSLAIVGGYNLVFIIKEPWSFMAPFNAAAFIMCSIIASVEFVRKD